MSTPAVRRVLAVRGVVQGVGFRPHVARLAGALDLAGTCRNDTAGVRIEVEGPAAAVAAFERRLRAEAPPLARIDAVAAHDVPPCGATGFAIIASADGAGERTLVPPDTAVCADCLAELRDPADRRYRHPFITCTNCGPRLSITVDLPYDRPNTTLAGFAMCAACVAEYADPLDRRYHAQPIGCHDCGPRLWYAEPGGPARPPEPASRAVDGERALQMAVATLAGGGIVAVKGIGGYHLACDASNAAAVTRLRERKHRPDRPLAVLVADLVAAGRVVDLPPGAAAVLDSPQRPIVLLPARPDAPVAEQIAPGLGEHGVLLAYAPVHHLLLADLAAATGRPSVLVLTSGNAAGEPLCHRDEDALERLAGIADGILGHDRPIVVPVEDSVIAWPDPNSSGAAGRHASCAPGGADGGADRGVPVRRSRGYAPLPVMLAPASGVGANTVLAAGAELKNTVALARDGQAFVSGHVGDLASLAAQEAHQQVTDQLLRFHRMAPALLVADRHPGYASLAWARRYAAELGVPVLEVQHHHAHLAALAAEHGRLAEPLLGLVFDGTGYGCDGGVWGGELLLLGEGGTTAQRLGRLGDVRLPGGDEGVRHPIRTAVLALLDAGLDVADHPLVGQLSPAELAVLRRAHDTGLATVPTSSVGRLFDVVAALLGVRHRVTYEAQAAIELEAAARTWRRLAGTASTDAPRLRLPVRTLGELTVLDPVPLVRDLAEHTRAGIPPGRLADAFHAALARAAAELAAGAASSHGVRTVGLTGGVFVNRLLLAQTSRELHDRGLSVLTHRVVPANDGGLALGQVAVGMATLASSTGGPMAGDAGRE